MLNVSELVGFPPILQPLQWFGGVERGENKKQKTKKENQLELGAPSRDAPSSLALRRPPARLSLVSRCSNCYPRPKLVIWAI
jgi:hypothetical protein